MFFLLQTYFDLNRYRGTDLWEPLRAGIQADMQRAYRDRKHDMKNHFDRVGGYHDVERARRCPPTDWSAEAWNKMIDLLFLTDEYRRTSDKNKICRSKLPHTSAHGCRPYAQRRYLEVIKYYSIS